ncbi:MAG: CPBP family intramembrane metalloprotease [Nitrospirae bacterium]|nr:CPBP family intramembrane metalloprotease [Nitrospirota bacterium]
MEATSFDKFLLAEYPYIGIFYIPLKFLFFNLTVMVALWFIWELIYRKMTIKYNKEIKLSSLMVFNIILASQFLPIIINIIYISIAVNIFNGLDIFKIVRFSADKKNFFNIATLGDVSVFVVTLYVVFKQELRKYMGLGVLLPIGFKKTLFYTFAGLMIFFLTDLIYSSFFGGDEFIVEMHHEMAKSASTVFIATVISGGLVIAPIGEEILFRGVIYTAIKERLGFITALFLQSALFSMIHGDNLMIAFILAIVSTIIYEKTKNLYPSIGLHFFHNLIFYVSVF